MKKFQDYCRRHPFAKRNPTAVYRLATSFKISFVVNHTNLGECPEFDELIISHTHTHFFFPQKKL